jgi:integrase/recombinase XerD
MSNPRAVRIRGPLARYVEGFCDELAGQGYVQGSAGMQLQLMAHVSRWLDGHGLGVGDLTSQRVDEFVWDRRCAGYAGHVSRRSLVALTGYLARLGVLGPSPEGVARPDDVVVGAYRRYLEIDRGLAATTIDHYVKIARDVLVRWGDEGLELAGVTAADVSQLVLRESRQRNIGSAKALITGLRSWLRFLNAEGLTTHDLNGAVPAVAAWGGGWIPRGLSEVEVKALLDGVKVTTAVGLRDRAVLLLLARLGLRAGEVAGLVLDDIDWHHGEIVVRGKGSHQDRLPLPVDVGEALAAYLRHGRPRVTSRAVFLKVQAPIVAVSCDGVGGIVALAGRRAGVRASAHRLRHSAATAMLRAGGSLAEVGQVLRHADVATTAIYAKVDHEALRGLALPWPGRTA